MRRRGIICSRISRKRRASRTSQARLPFPARNKHKGSGADVRASSPGVKAFRRHKLRFMPLPSLDRSRPSADLADRSAYGRNGTKSGRSLALESVYVFIADV
jgi:hypothetical protein